jgi:hypothetical protein
MRWFALLATKVSSSDDLIGDRIHDNDSVRRPGGEVSERATHGLEATDNG